MSKVLVSESNLSSIADAIREKSGTEDTYTPSQMAPAIRNISGGGGDMYQEDYDPQGAVISAGGIAAYVSEHGGAAGKGISGVVLNNDYTLTITYTDGSTYTTTSIRGAPGEAGPTGNGIESVVLNQDYTLTITYTDGTSYTTTSIRGPQGPTGPTGDAGDDGVSPTVSIVTITGGHRITITDAAHPSGQSFDVMDGSGRSGGSGDMLASIYDPNNNVAAAGGIEQYIEDNAQGALTFDNIPTQGSTNPVTSGGVYAALQNVGPGTVDAAPTQGSTNPVSSGGVYTALEGKQDELTFDAAPTENSSNPVTSGGVYAALQNAGGGTIDAAPTSGSNNAVSSGGVFTALEGKQDTLTFDNTPTASSDNPVKSGGIFEYMKNVHILMSGGTISLGTTWTGSDPYSQTATVTGVTITQYSKVDLQPGAAVINQLIADQVQAMWVENNDGILTVYAVGGVPSTALTIQCTVTETGQGTAGPAGNGIASVVLNQDYTLTIHFTDGTSTTTSSIRGAQGETGATGQNGTNGTDGTSPGVSISTITGGHRVTITDADHPSGQSFDVLDGNGAGDMIAATYDSTNAVASAGGIVAYVTAQINAITNANEVSY